MSVNSYDEDTEYIDPSDSGKVVVTRLDMLNKEREFICETINDPKTTEDEIKTITKIYRSHKKRCKKNWNDYIEILTTCGKFNHIEIKDELEAIDSDLQYNEEIGLALNKLNLYTKGG